MSWAIANHIDRGLAVDRPAGIDIPGKHYGWFATDTGVLSVWDGAAWVDIGPGAGGAVDSVFGRTGTVTAATSDYDAVQVDFTPAGTIAATNVQAAIEEVAAEATGGAVSSVFTRTGAVVAAAGDYTASQVTNTPAGGIAATTVQAAVDELDTEKQPVDADLTAIAALTPTNDDLIQRKTGVWTNRSMAQLIADLAALGTTFQGLDPTLTALAGLATGANKFPYSTGTDTFSQADLTAFARTLLDDADAATARATLGVGSLPPEIPSGTINGSNVTFTLSATPSPSANLLLWKNGLYQLQGVDYTLSGATITMTVAPATGSSLVAAVPTVGTTVIGGGGQLDYVEKQSTTNVTATTAAGATTVIDGNSVAYDGATRIKVEFYAPTCTPGSQFTLVTLWDGSTDLGQLVDTVSEHFLYGATFLTPSAGAHTYHIKAWKGTGTSTIYGGTGGSGGGGAGNYVPAWMRITAA